MKTDRICTRNVQMGHDPKRSLSLRIGSHILHW